ncbi:uncharacterized protein LOC144213889 isoform X2 [Stigmatopora nigra]
MKRGWSASSPPPPPRRPAPGPFPPATSLFSPDVGTKTASDLLMKLSEATQRAQALPGGREEPGPALSPDGPGASPDPPSFTRTLGGDSDAAADDTLASELLRKLAESRFPIRPHAEVKEEEEALEIPTPTTPGDGRPAVAHTVSERRREEDEKETVLTRGRPLFGDGLFSGAKMAEQCLRAALWQDMSVNLASTLLHRLSERAAKSGGVPPRAGGSCPVAKAEPTPSGLSEPAHGTASEPGESAGFFYRCHACGFETAGRLLFRSHLTEHRRPGGPSFSLRCRLCDHSADQEAAMRAHADQHSPAGNDRWPPAPATVATAATAAESGPPEHRCRICRRWFPGQPELLVHFQGHRQGNRYRCERCGHLTRTANKLVEHVRVHTGERPFTCHLCPYSAKRRDSLRLHCKVKHAGGGEGAGAAPAASDVHTHRSYAHGDNAGKRGGRSHASPAPPPPPLLLPPHHPHPPPPPAPPPPSLRSWPSQPAGWTDLLPLVPITTLLQLKARSDRPASPGSDPPAGPGDAPPSHKNAFLGRLGLTPL